MAKRSFEEPFTNSLVFKFLLILLGGLIVYLFNNQDQIRNFATTSTFNPQLPTNNNNCNEANVIQNTKDSVVRVSTDQGEGSGFAIKAEGYILTNYHVVKDSESPRIIFSDKTQVIGKVFNWDEKTDLAVIKVDRNNLKALPFGDSDKLTQGQTLIGIGFPLGQGLPGEATVTKGAYSAKRYVEETGVEYIQIDANLNPGNSGSPVITSCGEVIGIYAASISGTEGLKFAISSKTTKSMTDSLIATGPKQFQSTVKDDDNQFSPETTVNLYYYYISIRQLDVAWNLLSKRFQNYVQGYDRWLHGYDTTLNVFLLDIGPGNGNNTVKIKLGSVDDVSGQVLYKVYSGVYTLVIEDEVWKIDNANISQVQ
ncbi:MAG: trypsin-like peptidase domain-containing protein [Candidatus Daviesbacteria bacterium]|nr:trypsin-like peptidase domain-containing protein [Candidatus Daviesbacteria bacterium]